MCLWRNTRAKTNSWAGTKTPAAFLTKCRLTTGSQVHSTACLHLQDNQIRGGGNRSRGLKDGIRSRQVDAPELSLARWTLSTSNQHARHHAVLVCGATALAGCSGVTISSHKPFEGSSTPTILCCCFCPRCCCAGSNSPVDQRFRKKIPPHTHALPSRLFVNASVCDLYRDHRAGCPCEINRSLFNWMPL